MNRLRIWRLRRAYRAIAKLEVALDFHEEAVQLRIDFARGTMHVLTRGRPRGERRALLRQIVRTP